MTRVNANIQPAELINKHLMGEYFEIRRVRLVKPSNDKNIKFKLGTGHVRFFATNKTTTIQRLKDISAELIDRQLITYGSYLSTLQLFYNAWGEKQCNDNITESIYCYEPAESDLARFRILQSLYKIYKKSDLQKYKKQHLNFIDAVKLLNFCTTDYINYVDAILGILQKYISNNVLTSDWKIDDTLKLLIEKPFETLI